MQVYDASSMIYAWDNYPIEQFPGMWEWMETQITDRQFVMPLVAYEEVLYKTPECSAWLDRNNLERLGITNDILQHSLQIKNLLGIINDNYHPNGVDENDIFIIATAWCYKYELVSNEGRQQLIPKNFARMKIPAVCAMGTIGIPCINFIELIKRSGQVFR